MGCAQLIAVSNKQNNPSRVMLVVIVNKLYLEKETMAKHHHQRIIGRKSSRTKATRKYRRRETVSLNLVKSSTRRKEYLCKCGRIFKTRGKLLKRKPLVCDCGRNIGATATTAE